jgi:hypothetical protein
MILSRPNTGQRVGRGMVLFLIVASLLLNFAEAANITITGSWALTIVVGDLTGRPGTNLTANYNSATNQVLMDVTTGAGMAWRVDVLRIDTHWTALVTLSIRRTGTGSGTGTVTGGGAFMAITTTSQTFVTGTGNRAGIQLQERISGVSVSIPADIYTTTVQYTVVDT